MEWVETIGKTIAEAKEKALDQLGVHEEDADFEVLEEPKQGLFGRVRGEARVRARVRPTQARQKVDRRDRKRGDKAAKAAGGDGEGTSEPRAPRSPRPPRAPQGSKPNGKSDGKSDGRSDGNGTVDADRAGTPKAAKAPRAAKSPSSNPNPKPSKDSEPKEQLVDARQVGEEAVRFMTDLVSAFGLTGTAELVEDGDDLEVRVHGQELGLLVGPRGTTLQAVQDLARVAAQRRLGDHDTRLRVDVGGYRERRRVALGAFATQMADEVKASGVARVLEPMSSADRKIIHDTLSGADGIATRSEGDDPYRRVIIAPANG